jgi:hypothetical protein
MDRIPEGWGCIGRLAFMGTYLDFLGIDQICISVQLRMHKLNKILRHNFLHCLDRNSTQTYPI